MSAGTDPIRRRGPVASRGLRSHPYVAIAKQQGDEPHLGPEHDRGGKAVKLRKHHQQTACKNESEACYHPAVHTGQASQLRGPVRRRRREAERGAIRRDATPPPTRMPTRMQIVTEALTACGRRGAPSARGAAILPSTPP